MRKINKLTRATAVCAVLSLVGPASTFAEQWPRSVTVDRAIRAAGVILGQRQVSRDRQIQTAATITLGQLEEWLRRRSRDRQRRPAPEPERRRDPASQRGGYHAGLIMPVAGVSWKELQDSFGDARSGGRRHMGIDIFAPRWTEALAATDGYLTSIGVGERSGRSLWLVGRDGRAFFYAHLQQWAEGVYEGMPVRAGELIGYVGNSGNAAGTPTHLHFEARDESGRTVNPYVVLANAEPMNRPVQVATNRRGARRAG